MWAATLATRRIIAQSKNTRTTLGKMSPTGIAFNAAWAAIDAYRKVYDGEDREQAIQLGINSGG